MWGSLGALLFIAAAGGTAAYVATRPTRLAGEVMAGQLLPSLKASYDAKIQTLACDDRIAVLNTMTKFDCVATRGDGTKLFFTYTLSRDGTRHGVATSVDDPQDRFLRERGNRGTGDRNPPREERGNE